MFLFLPYSLQVHLSRWSFIPKRRGTIPMRTSRPSFSLHSYSNHYVLSVILGLPFLGTDAWKGKNFKETWCMAIFLAEILKIFLLCFWFLLLWDSLSQFLHSSLSFRGFDPTVHSDLQDSERKPLILHLTVNFLQTLSFMSGRSGPPPYISPVFVH